MTTPFKLPQDFNKIPAKNFAFEGFTSNPETPVQSLVFFDENSNTLKYWDNTKWVGLGGGGIAISPVGVTGTIDGSNRVFTLSDTINYVGFVYLNGLLLKEGVDYNIVSTTLTFVVAQTPAVDSIIQCFKTTEGIDWGNITGTLSDQTDLQSALDAKQDTLVSGTNIKTINSQSILGSGDLAISVSPAGSDTQVQFNDGGSFGGDAGLTYNKTTDNLIVAGKVDAKSLQVNGASGAGHIDLKHQSADATPSTAFTALFADSNGNIKYKNDGGYYTTLSTNANTADRIYTFQDKSYIVADNADLAAKQDTLVSGTNIKTINGDSILGSGNLVISSGGTPGGTSGQIQYNNAGSFGGFTVSGDGTLNSSTGALTITKTNGTSFAASATIDTTNASNISSGILAQDYGGTGTDVINWVVLPTAINLTIPNFATGTLAFLDNAQTFSGQKTFSSQPKFPGNGAIFNGSTSGTLTIKAPAIAASNIITFPAGTTDFSVTGGTSQVVKQTTAGGAFTVAQLVQDDISGLTTASSPSFAGLTVSGLTASTALALDASKNLVSITNTGSGNNVLSNSPTLVTPILGTPTSGTLTNCTGYATSNLSGTISNGQLANSSITIAGNATSLGSSVTQDEITGLSSTGLVKRTASNTLATAVSGTDYAPATSGSAILYGDGSGGFSNVTIGSNLTFSGGTLSASGGGGVSDGDKGDITVSNSGATWTVNPATLLLNSFLFGA